MKFPLPPDTFPPLLVSDEDADALINLSTAFVDEAVVEYEEFLAQGGVVDDTRWKSVKKKDTVTVYQDRSVKITKASTFENDAMVGSFSFSTKLHGVLGVGRIPGALDDMMYGLLRTTSEMLKIKTVYMDDKNADAKVLATILEPSVEDPMRSLCLKWSLSDFAAPVVKRFVRPRDFVYLESLGFRETSDGERLGFIFMHSIQVPGIHVLEEYQIVRASISFCGLYRQLPDGELDFYMKGFVDSAGDIHKGIAVPATADAMLSFRKAVYCAKMKKLNWSLKTQKSVIVDLASTKCCVCASKLRSPASAKSCQICMNRACAYCIVPKTLCFVSTAQRKPLTKRMLFCRRCIDNAERLNGLDIAAEEARRQNPFSAFELSSDSNSGVLSPTDSASIDIQREFFG